MVTSRTICCKYVFEIWELYIGSYPLTGFQGSVWEQGSELCNIDFTCYLRKKVLPNYNFAKQVSLAVSRTIQTKLIVREYYIQKSKTVIVLLNEFSWRKQASIEKKYCPLTFIQCLRLF